MINIFSQTWATQALTIWQISLLRTCQIQLTIIIKILKTHDSKSEGWVVLAPQEMDRVLEVESLEACHLWMPPRAWGAIAEAARTVRSAAGVWSIADKLLGQAETYTAASTEAIRTQLVRKNDKPQLQTMETLGAWLLSTKQLLMTMSLSSPQNHL